MEQADLLPSQAYSAFTADALAVQPSAPRLSEPARKPPLDKMPILLVQIHTFALPPQPKMVGNTLVHAHCMKGAKKGFDPTPNQDNYTIVEFDNVRRSSYIVFEKFFISVHFLPVARSCTVWRMTICSMSVYLASLKESLGCKCGVIE